jgi:hypothetical protein
MPAVKQIGTASRGIPRPFTRPAKLDSNKRSSQAREMDREPHDICGIWYGTYFYENPILSKSKPAGVSFQLKLTRSSWQRLWGRFSGTVTEYPSQGMPETGIVKGRVNDTGIAFTKYMPVMHFSSGSDRPVPVSQALRKAGHELEREIERPPIFYSGRFLSESEATGTWRLKAATVILSNGTRIDSKEGRGTFVLRR